MAAMRETPQPPPYASSRLRKPERPLLLLPGSLSERSGPVYGHGAVTEVDRDLTRQHEGSPLGQKILVGGRVVDLNGRPVRDTLIEIWQANASGRYSHQLDRNPAPLDPNFSGTGRCKTNADGWYSFTTVKPGAYPWQNHENAWRPAHIHFSVLGPEFSTRLITQMYFPGDPLFGLDPIVASVADAEDRELMIGSLDLDLTEPGVALGYRFDIVVTRGAVVRAEH